VYGGRWARESPKHDDGQEGRRNTAPFLFDFYVLSSTVEEEEEGKEEEEEEGEEEEEEEEGSLGWKERTRTTPSHA